MHIEVRTPSSLLSPYVKAYCSIESKGDCANSVLPDTSVIMAFNYKGTLGCIAGDVPISLPSSSLSGLRKSLRQFNYSKDAGNILVIFREGQAAAFFNEPLHHLYEATISLDSFVQKRVLSVITDELFIAQDIDERILLIERLLLSQLREHRPDHLISAAVRNIYSTNGNIKIKDLAHALYISQDALEKRFRRTVGTSPKQFTYLVRMKSVTTPSFQKYKLSDVALNAGFYDQPHFNKDFKLFTGQTPADFFKSSPALQINDFLQ